jgi:hypothetical protein
MTREARDVATTSDARPWVKVKGSAAMRCTRHDVTFRLPKVCEACSAEPALDLEDEIDAPVAPPKGCRSLEQHERWFVALANAALASAHELAKLKRRPPLPKKPKKKPAIEVVDANEAKAEIDLWDLRDFHDEAAIAKYREVALKANRAAAVLAQRRTDEVQVNEREKRIRDRARVSAAAGGGH